MANYRVFLRHSEEGYSVSCPGLPGCWSQGATEAEALANIQIAIHEYVEAEEFQLLESKPGTYAKLGRLERDIVIADLGI